MSLVHGEGIVSVNGNVITVKIQGSFNREGIVKYQKKLTTIIESFHAEKFKMLIDFLDAEGATPNALKQVDTFNTWLNDKNLVAKAVVINSPVLLKILFSRTPAQKSQNIKCFDNTIEAHQWLKSQS
jgi:hypothetical protein